MSIVTWDFPRLDRFYFVEYYVSHITQKVPYVPDISVKYIFTILLMVLLLANVDRSNLIHHFIYKIYKKGKKTPLKSDEKKKISEREIVKEWWDNWVGGCDERVPFSFNLSLSNSSEEKMEIWRGNI